MVYGHPPFAALEPWQRMLRLSDPGLIIQLPESQRLQAWSPATRAQLLEVLGRCLQRDPRRRPSLAELLAHPFLRTKLEVRREVLETAVEALMAGVLRVAAAAEPHQPPLPLEEDSRPWRALADHFWEHLLAADTALAPPGAGCGAGAARDAFESGLAPLREQFSHWAEARRHTGPAAGAAVIAATGTSAGHAAGAVAQAAPQPWRQPLRALAASTSAANVALGSGVTTAGRPGTGGGVVEQAPLPKRQQQQRQQQQQKQGRSAAAGPPPGVGGGWGKENAGVCGGWGKENAGAAFACAQQGPEAVRPHPVAETRELLVRHLRS